MLFIENYFENIISKYSQNIIYLESPIFLLETTNLAMADVLSVIREYNVSKKDIEESGDLVVFGNKAWQKTAKTNYVAYG